MSSQSSHSCISPEDYLILDEASETRYEYLNGEIYAMTGGTPKLSKIIYNLTGLSRWSYVFTKSKALLILLIILPLDMAIGTKN